MMSAFNLVNCILQGLRYLAVEIVEGSQIHAAVGEGVGDCSAGELAIDNVLDGLEDGHIDLLLDAAQLDAGVFTERKRTSRCPRR